MKTFAITGVAGYIAPRHLKAIKDTGNVLIAATDPHDSVGILDQYFPETAYFREFERFDRHLDKLKHTEKKVDYISICSPNHLHDAHIRLALRIGADAICEKPLVLNPWNLDALAELEKEYAKKIYTVLQLRLHPALMKLKESLDAEPKGKKHKVELTYITSRGPWYRYSWKGDHQKSGGIATNIGIHFFDMLTWMFGNYSDAEVEFSESERMKGKMSLENAEVDWFLSIDAKDLPKEAIDAGRRTHRSIKIDGNEIEFTDGFTDLHRDVYRDILAGNGFGIEDARNSIELVYRLRGK
ncbi:MAG TPA: Gfo/Idh/MocA family oxidoreductase [Ignavibacteriaceae bacterium]|nr:Gfo/Idh/MocA family oxidoreductase [Ignavibacteriaceae bacterium]